MSRVAGSGTRVSSLNVGGFSTMLLLPAVENRDSTPTHFTAASPVWVREIGAQGLHREFSQR